MIRQIIIQFINFCHFNRLETKYYRLQKEILHFRATIMQ